VLSSRDQRNASSDFDEDEAPPALATDEGRWALPEQVESLAKSTFVNYIGPTMECAPAMTKKAQGLAKMLKNRYSWIKDIGGLACRENTASRRTLSMHSTGRAIDIHIPYAAGQRANRSLGDPVASYLVSKAEAFGIQMVIWRKSEWNASRGANEKMREYRGKNPHLDHIHVEVTEE
jgi:hypothetical protein